MDDIKQQFVDAGYNGTVIEAKDGLEINPWNE
jgi:hypothetical protein